MVGRGHQREEIQKGKRCSKGWKRVCSIGWEVEKKVHPCTHKILDANPTIAVGEGKKAATRVSVLATPEGITTTGNLPDEGMIRPKEKTEVTEIGGQGQEGRI